MMSSLLRPYSLGLFALVFIGAGCSITAVPVPGTWDFNMNPSTANLSGICPTGFGSFSSGGEGSLSVSASGDVVTMNLSGQTIVFYDHLAPGPQYKTHTRAFPTMTEEGNPATGNVWFDFTASDSEHLNGNIHWNNLQGCKGDYPFEMSLVEVELPDFGLYALQEGTWSLEIEGVENDCGADIGGFSGIPDSLDLSQSVDLDTGEPMPDEIHLQPLDTILQRVPDTNMFVGSESSSFDPGLPETASGDVLLDYEDAEFSADMELSAVGPDAAYGTIFVSGGGCNVTMMVNMSFVP